MKSVVDGWQYLLIFLSISCLIVILISMAVNEKNSKYVKSHYDECKYHSILDLYEEGSHICCDSEHHSSSWLCIASFDSINKFLSSNWAFLIPLVPYLTTICIKPSHSIIVDAKRLFVYILILIYRTVLDCILIFWYFDCILHLHDNVWFLHFMIAITTQQTYPLVFYYRSFCTWFLTILKAMLLPPHRVSWYVGAKTSSHHPSM